MQPPYDGVILDMDGVLCDSEPLIRQAAMQMLAETHNIRVKAEDFLPFVGAGEDRYLGGVAEKYGVRLHPARDKKRTYEIYLRLIRGRLQPLPGAAAFVERCAARGLRLALASSADKVKVDGNLAAIGIGSSRFHVVVAGDSIERKKPDPQIFLTAAARLGVAPARALVVEDAPNGVQAAKAAGCRCLALTTSFPAATLRQAGADFTAPDLAHVPEEAWA